MHRFMVVPADHVSPLPYFARIGISIFPRMYMVVYHENTLSIILNMDLTYDTYYVPTCIVIPEALKII